MKKHCIIALFLAAFASFSLASCSSEEPSQVSSFSTLTGKFVLNEQIDCVVSQQEGVTSDKNVLVSTSYPQIQEGAPVDYVVDARLKLMRDYTYSYTYTIELKNSGWADAAASFMAEFSGTFTYKRSVFEPSSYSVKLSDPTAGKLTVTGASMYSYMSGNGLNKWTIHETPDAVFDLTYLFSMGYGSNEYCSGREVEVNTKEKILADELYFSHLLDFVSIYNTYQ